MILLLLACTNRCEEQAERYRGVLAACGVPGADDPFEYEKNHCNARIADDMACQVNCLGATDCSTVDGSAGLIGDPAFWSCLDACTQAWEASAR